jgi:thioredoxin-dependent peroxiredoxin
MQNRPPVFLVPLGVAVLSAMTASAAVTLKPGDPAPTFSLPGSDGRTYQLAEYKGKQAVVLAWFAKAFTGG